MVLKKAKENIKKSPKSSKKSFPKNKIKDTSKKKSNIIIKLISIFGIMFCFSMFFTLQTLVINEEEKLYTNNAYNFENTISLLAVHELENGTIHGGSVIPLHLEVKKGNGQVFVNLNSYSEIDTQISITNSNQVVCELLELSCDQFDFYYSFDDSTLVLKGPSASTSIAVLTYATLHHIQLPNDIALTGSLSSNGVIGMVGGVEKKIEIANNLGFSKVFVPLNSVNTSELNGFKSNLFSSVEVIEVLDIISLLDKIFREDISLRLDSFEIENYKKHMAQLSNSLCEFSNDYINDLSKYNYSLNRINTSLDQLNKSHIAKNTQEFYSQGSFCYSANLGLKNELNRFEISTAEDLEIELTNQEKIIENKISYYNSNFVSTQITTLNDVYVFLLVKNRLYEAKELLNTSKQSLKNYYNYSLNENRSNYTKFREEEFFNKSIRELSFSQERFKTVLAWESLFKKTQSKEIQFSKSQSVKLCRIQISEIKVLHELLKQYSVDFFEDSIIELEELISIDPYRCLYTSLELKGRMNSIIGSITIQEGEYEQTLSQLQDVALKRLQFHSQNELPLIPYIYYEYAQSLTSVGNYDSALQYSYLSLSFSELNTALDSKKQSNDSLNMTKDIFKNQKETLLKIEMSSYVLLILGAIFIGFNLKF